MLRVRHPDVAADATCVDEAQYLAVYAPAGWALVVDEEGEAVTSDAGVPVAHLGAADDGPDFDVAPIPDPVVDPEPDVIVPPESPVSVPEPKPDPADFVDFAAAATGPDAPDFDPDDPDPSTPED